MLHVYSPEFRMSVHYFWKHFFFLQHASSCQKCRKLYPPVMYAGYELCWTRSCRQIHVRCSTEHYSAETFWHIFFVLKNSGAKRNKLEIGSCQRPCCAAQTYTNVISKLIFPWRVVMQWNFFIENLVSGDHWIVSNIISMFSWTSTSILRRY